MDEQMIKTFLVTIMGWIASFFRCGIPNLQEPQNVTEIVTFSYIRDRIYKEVINLRQNPESGI